jgi:hypothetical protein
MSLPYHLEQNASASGSKARDVMFFSGPKDRFTIWLFGAFGYKRTEISGLIVETGPYAQYAKGYYVKYIEKGKRKVSGFTGEKLDCYVARGWGHTLEQEQMEQVDSRSSRSRFSSFAPEWKTEFATLAYRSGIEFIITPAGLVQIAIEQIEQSDGWPHPTVSEDFKAGRNVWRETTKAVFEDQLNAVPPIKYDGERFMVGEPANHTNDDTVFSAFVRVRHGGRQRYFVRQLPFKKFDAATNELRQYVDATLPPIAFGSKAPLPGTTVNREGWDA